MSEVLRACVWCAVSDPQQAYKGKESLPRQEKDGLAAAKLINADVVAVLKVPGFSRDYLTALECAEDMAAAKVYAMRDLLHLMQTKAFDVLICRDADRFGRTQSLIAYITEYIIQKMAGRIYATSKGLWVDKSNFRMWAAMAGFAAASELDTFRARHTLGMAARFKRGLHPGKPPLSHRVERDTKGNAVRLVLDESRARLLTDLATLLIDEHIAYDRLSLELYRRFGHVNERGNPWSDTTFEKLLYNPWFWGHAAEGHAGPGRRGWTGMRMRWAYDKSCPPPPGIAIYYATHPAAYSGDLAVKVMAELARRERIKGRARPDSAYPYSGLLRCGWCGYSMSGSTRHYKQRGVYAYYRCTTSYRSLRSINSFQVMGGYLKACRSNHISGAIIDVEVRKFLEEAIADETVLLGAETRSRVQEAEALAQEIADLTGQLAAMIDEQAMRKGAARELYAQKIDAMGERLDILKQAQARAQAALHQEERVSETRRGALAEIRAAGVDVMMSRAYIDPARYNQVLSMLIKRIIIKADEADEITIEL